MRVGDLVKFRKDIAQSAGSDPTGVVMEIHGELLRVMWSNKTWGIELPAHMVVVNESR